MRISGCTPSLLLVGLLAGCAPHTTPVATIEPAPLTGRLTGGVVVSVRNIDPTQDTAITQLILTTLGQSQMAVPAVPSEEVVIERDDQTPTSIVETAQTGASGYVAGEKIAIVEAAATLIHPD